MSIHSMKGPSGRMRVLVVLSSSNQMYSGIGRAAFEFAERLSDRARFEFAIDDRDERNSGLVTAFCRRLGLEVHLGRGSHAEHSLDNLNLDLPALIAEDRWDFVECICFANTGTNETVIEALSPDVTVGYTPHDQPTWTVPMVPSQAERLLAIHRRLLDRSDVVFCDSDHERRRLQALSPGRNHCVTAPLGCDFDAFRPGPAQRREQLLFVGDLVEPRKRFDRVLRVFARVLQEYPSLRLAIVGNQSERAIATVPAEIRHAVEFRGYVTEEQLRAEYATSAGLLLLSDFEAFGIPILEALTCGTPVFLSQQAETMSLFGSFRGAHFCPADDAEATARMILQSLSSGPSAIATAISDRARLSRTFDWEVVAEIKWRAMTSAWALRHALKRSA